MNGAKIITWTDRLGERHEKRLPAGHTDADRKGLLRGLFDNGQVLAGSTVLVLDVEVQEDPRT